MRPGRSAIVANSEQRILDLGEDLVCGAQEQRYSACEDTSDDEHFEQIPSIPTKAIPAQTGQSDTDVDSIDEGEQ